MTRPLQYPSDVIELFCRQVFLTKRPHTFLACNDCAKSVGVPLCY